MSPEGEVPQQISVQQKVELLIGQLTVRLMVTETERDQLKVALTSAMQEITRLSNPPEEKA